MEVRLAGALGITLATLCGSVPIIPPECSKHESTNHPVHLAHESDCTKFYKCDRGKKSVIDFPVYNDEGAKLHFNATLQYCDWPENTDCKSPQPISVNLLKTVIPTKCPKANWQSDTV